MFKGVRLCRAFTLIEIMVAIGIIAILAAIGTTSYVRSKEQAKLAACMSNEKLLADALQQYANDHDGCYPDSLSDLQIEGGDNAGSYLKQAMPVCPTNNSVYGYNNSKPHYDYDKVVSSDYFRIYCNGNHKSLGYDRFWPKLDSEIGVYPMNENPTYSKKD